MSLRFCGNQGIFPALLTSNIMKTSIVVTMCYRRPNPVANAQSILYRLAFGSIHGSISWGICFISKFSFLYDNMWHNAFRVGLITSTPAKLIDRLHNMTWCSLHPCSSLSPNLNFAKRLLFLLGICSFYILLIVSGRRNTVCSTSHLNIIEHFDAFSR